MTQARIRVTLTRIRVTRVTLTGVPTFFYWRKRGHKWLHCHGTSFAATSPPGLARQRRTADTEKLWHEGVWICAGVVGLATLWGRM